MYLRKEEELTIDALQDVLLNLVSFDVAHLLGIPVAQDSFPGIQPQLRQQSLMEVVPYCADEIH
jgi:hypothetical protein